MVSSLIFLWFCLLVLPIAINAVSHEDLLKRLPEGISLEEVDEMAQNATARLLEKLYQANDHTRARNLEFTNPPVPNYTAECNTVIETITNEDLRSEIRAAFEQLGVSDYQLTALELVVLSRLDFDLQIWKICGRCSDFSDASALLENTMGPSTFPTMSPSQATTFTPTGTATASTNGIPKRTSTDAPSASSTEEIRTARVRTGFRHRSNSESGGSTAPSGCQPDEYAYEALHSGLFLAPYDSVNERFLPSTRPVNIMAPAAGSVASEAWTRPLLDAHLLIGSFISSTSNAYTIIPDYVGFGESKNYYRGFLLQNSIVTATLPLIWQAETIVEQFSDCSAAMANAYTVFGYSEGGYGAVAIAEALQKDSNKIVAVHAGGGPFEVSSITLLDAVQKVNDGFYDMSFFIALLGAGLSSTVTSVANYQQGQDFFNAQFDGDDLDSGAPTRREALIAAVQVARVERGGVYELIPRNDPLSVFNPDLVGLYEEALSTGSSDNPCLTHAVVNETDKICQALRDQDIGHILHTAQYPIYLCHSKEDQLVPYKNVPPAGTNPDYLHIKTVTGEHTPAAVPCALNALWFFMNPANLRDVAVQDKTVAGGCAASSETSKPTGCQFLVLRVLGFC